MGVVVHKANIHDSLVLESFRRIAMDYEFYSDIGETMVQLAFCRLMYNKIYD